ncbi:MAG: MarR family transcriptional regulator [Tissierellia bacterium]|nr:MarR family transcriptional regulator [Tissierellia bacterium]
MKKEVVMQLKGSYQRISQIMQSKIDEYGLTLGLLFIMHLIEKNPDASQKELANKLKFTEGAMSSAVKRLLELEMVKQIPLERDMRYNRLLLTDKGRSMMDIYQGLLLKIEEDMFDGFDSGELEKLYDYLLKINRNLDNISS